MRHGCKTTIRNNLAMQLEDLPGKTCVIGLSYFGLEGELLKQSQCAGTVSAVDGELGISVQLQHSDPAVAQPVFMLPPNLACWFKAAPGRYRHADTGMDMLNPDYLVTWDIHRTQRNTAEGKHEWWEWVPNTVAPQVGAPAAQRAWTNDPSP